MHQSQAIDSNMKHTKGDEVSVEFVEDRVLALDTHVDLTEEHRSYLLGRHGTFLLDPIPDIDDADPYNWSKFKVSFSCISTAFQGTE